MHELNQDLVEKAVNAEKLSKSLQIENSKFTQSQKVSENAEIVQKNIEL